MLHGIAQAEIERDAASIAREAVGGEITFRQEKKKERVRSYVDEEAPWHKAILEKIDLSGLSYNPTNEEIEGRLQKEKFAQELVIKRDVTTLLAETNLENVRGSVIEIVSKISDTSKNDLIHYIAMHIHATVLNRGMMQGFHSCDISYDGLVDHVPGVDQASEGRDLASDAGQLELAEFVHSEALVRASGGVPEAPVLTAHRPPRDGRAIARVPA